MQHIIHVYYTRTLPFPWYVGTRRLIVVRASDLQRSCSNFHFCKGHVVSCISNRHFCMKGMASEEVHKKKNVQQKFFKKNISSAKSWSLCKFGEMFCFSFFEFFINSNYLFWNFREMLFFCWPSSDAVEGNIAAGFLTRTIIIKLPTSFISDPRKWIDLFRTIANTSTVWSL